MKQYAWCLAFLPVLVACHRASAAQTDDVPQPWTPPKTSVPADVVEATSFLLKHGMGDPRGGQPAEAEVTGNNSWDGGGKPVPLMGWSLDGGKRFVGIDGLVYKPIRVLRTCTLDDIAGLPSRTAPQAKNLHPAYRERDNLWVPLLLVLGETARAEKLCPPSPQDIAPLIVTKYAELRFHRAVAAHMRGDDLLALSDAKALQNYANDYKTFPTSQASPFDFLKPVDDLIADSERRIKNPRKVQPDLAAIAKLPKQERIAALIDALDEVNERQWGQPGGVSIGSSPIIQAIIKEGDDAGDALLDCMEKDKRLTRSVSFGRHFFPARNLISVRDCAYTALVEIAQMSLVAPGQPISVSKLREVWSKNKGIGPVERWYRALQNDSLTVREWSGVATQLTTTTNVHRSGNWVSTIPTKGPVPFYGEPLRSKTHPSVTELLKKRALEGLQDPLGDSNKSFDQSYRIDIAITLAKWEGKRAVPFLHEFSKKLFTSNLAHDSMSVGICAIAIARYVQTCVTLGDQETLTTYAQWLPQVKWQESGSVAFEIFYPLVKNPQQPEVQKAAREVFAETSPFFERGSDNLSQQLRDQVVDSPLLLLPKVKEMAIRRLKDRTAIGHITRKGKVLFCESKGWTGTFGPDRSFESDPLVPKDGEKRELRQCDRMAMILRDLKVLPTVQPYWPTVKKDQGIAQIISRLSSPGFSAPFEQFHNAHFQFLEQFFEGR